jgi:hypothetical protein
VPASSACDCWTASRAALACRFIATTAAAGREPEDCACGGRETGERTRVTLQHSRTTSAPGLGSPRPHLH